MLKQADFGLRAEGSLTSVWDVQRRLQYFFWCYTTSSYIKNGMTTNGFFSNIYENVWHKIDWIKWHFYTTKKLEDKGSKGGSFH